VLLIMLVGLVSIVLVFLCVSWATVSVHLFVPCCPAVMLHCKCICSVIEINK